MEPEPREDRVGGDDPQPDVRVVHPDPALREEHPVDEDDQPEQHGDRAAPEQEPGQDVQEDRHQDAGHDAGDAPRVGMPADLDGGHAPAGVEREQLLAVRGWVLLVLVEHHRDRDEAQRGVGIDRVAVRLDDVDRVRAGAPVRCRHRPFDVDHLRREVVVRATGRRPGQRQRLVEVGPWVVAGLGDHDRDAGAVRRGHRRVERVVLDVVDPDEAFHRPADVERLADARVGGVDEGDAVRGAHRDAVVTPALGQLGDPIERRPAELDGRAWCRSRRPCSRSRPRSRSQARARPRAGSRRA